MIVERLLGGTPKQRVIDDIQINRQHRSAPRQYRCRHARLRRQWGNACRRGREPKGRPSLLKSTIFVDFQPERKTPFRRQLVNSCRMRLLSPAWRTRSMPNSDFINPALIKTAKIFWWLQEKYNMPCNRLPVADLRVVQNEHENEIHSSNQRWRQGKKLMCKKITIGM